MVRWHMNQIKKFFPLFDRKIITIAIMDTDEVMNEMKDEMEEAGAEVYLTPNDVNSREATPFFTVSGPKIASPDPDTFLFYGHSKGASPGRPVSYAITEWCVWMYYYLLEQFPDVQLAFSNPVTDAVGIFKCTSGPKVISEMRPGTWHQIGWHYPGTFYWVRQSAAFKNNDWIFPETEEAWHATSNELWLPYVIPDPNRAANLCSLPKEFVNTDKPAFANRLFNDDDWEAMYKNHKAIEEWNRPT